MAFAVRNGLTASGMPPGAAVAPDPTAADGAAGGVVDFGAAFSMNHCSRSILNAVSCRGAGVLLTNSMIPSKSAFSLSSISYPNSYASAAQLVIEPRPRFPRIPRSEGYRGEKLAMERIVTRHVRRGCGGWAVVIAVYPSLRDAERNRAPRVPEETSRRNP